MGAVTRHMSLLLSLAAPTSSLPEKRLFTRLLRQLLELDADTLLAHGHKQHPGQQQQQQQVPELVQSFVALVTGLKAGTGKDPQDCYVLLAAHVMWCKLSVLLP
jgi:hypothetical protein